MEKGGIIKKGVPVVVGETTPETRPIFEALAQEVEAPIVFAEEHAEVLSSVPRTEGGYHYTTRHLGEFDCELGGIYQPKNMNSMLPVLNELVKQGYLCNCEKPEFVAMANQEMNDALTSIGKLTGLSGRWQKVKDHPTVVCDTGHNVGGWEYLSRQIAEVNCSCKRIVFGMLEDKDVYGVMSLLPKDAVYYYCRPTSDRALPEQSVQVFGQQIGLSGQAYPDVKSAYEAALNDASADDFIFVGGSNYIVADFLKLPL